MRVAMQVPDLVAHLVLSVTSAGIDRRLLGIPDWLPTWQAGDFGSSWVADPQPSLDALLRDVHIPTLLIWADHDEISPLPIGKRLAELLPESELVVYPSDDHWVVRANAEDVASRIERHLSKRRG